MKCIIFILQKMDKCLCSSRVCNNPTPQHGGSKCVGASVKVTNCTVHGGWTAWSAWSTCSNTCGLAMRTRKRTCTNPAPAYGGRVCLGYDYDETMCIDLPPCPTESKQTELSQSGQWSPWSSWGDCSRICNGGNKTNAFKLFCDYIRKYKTICKQLPFEFMREAGKVK